MKHKRRQGVGEQLAALMIDHNVGVSDRETYIVKRVDSDYFGDET